MNCRYAIYLAPSEASLLWRTASQWLGRDAARNVALAQPEVPGYSAEQVAALTQTPRLYGFHATLKAPFHLDEVQSAVALCGALAQFAQERVAFALPELEVATLSGFLALLPKQRSAALHALADDCMAAFEPFRRPPEAGELARRRVAGLTARQDALLARFGYPYVLDQFRFHMTLTGPLEPSDGARLRQWLGQHFAAALNEPIHVGDLCLFVQDRPDAEFFILQRFPLKPR
jgi:putative phosphonate metabolism protein